MLKSSNNNLNRITQCGSFFIFKLKKIMIKITEFSAYNRIFLPKYSEKDIKTLQLSHNVQYDDEETYDLTFTIVDTDDSFYTVDVAIGNMGLRDGYYNLKYFDEDWNEIGNEILSINIEEDVLDYQEFWTYGEFYRQLYKPLDDWQSTYISYTMLNGDGGGRNVGTTVGTSLFRNFNGNGYRGLYSISFGDGIEGISDGACRENYFLKTVHLPSSLDYLAQNVFRDCWNLESLEIPTGVTEIHEYVCYGDESLKTVTMNTELNEIGKYAFADCYSLSSVTNASARKIGESAFESTAIEKYNTDGIIDVIDQYAFYNCTKLKQARILAYTIHHRVFQYSGIESYCNYLSRYTYVEDSTFEGCENLRYFKGKYVDYVGESAFENCPNLEKVVLGNLQGGESQAFAYCPKLNKIYLCNTSSMPNNLAYNAFDGVSTEGTLYVYRNMLNAAETFKDNYLPSDWVVEPITEPIDFDYED